MSEETAKLERDNTMVATAKEGEAFLEAKGKVNEDAKTRAQQKEIEEITETEEEDAELKRTRTMAETAKEGEELLDGEELGKTRSQTESEKNGKAEEESDAPKENGKDKEDKAEENGADEDADKETKETTEDNDDDEKSPMKRTRTMEETVKEGEEFVKKQKLETEGGEAEEVKS